MTKLTLVSVSSQGRKINLFANLPVDEASGKVYAPMKLVNAMLAAIGVRQRGITYTIGS